MPLSWPWPWPWIRSYGISRVSLLIFLCYIGHLAIALWLLWLLCIKWWYCTWPNALALCCCFLFAPLLYDNIICGQFFFHMGSQSVSCKASLAALRLYDYFCDFCFVFVSENKYDDDDESSTSTYIPNFVQIGKLWTRRTDGRWD